MAGRRATTLLRPDYEWLADQQRQRIGALERERIEMLERFRVQNLFLGDARARLLWLEAELDACRASERPGG